MVVVGEKKTSNVSGRVSTFYNIFFFFFVGWLTVMVV